MKTNKIKLLLIDVNDDEIEKGVFEKKESFKKITAYKEEIFQNRLDIARKDGLVISGRFKVRTMDIVNPEYLEVNNIRYRVSSIQSGAIYSYIEAGEQV